MCAMKVRWIGVNRKYVQAEASSICTGHVINIQQFACFAIAVVLSSHILKHMLVYCLNVGHVCIGSYDVRSVSVFWIISCRIPVGLVCRCGRLSTFIWNSWWRWCYFNDVFESDISVHLHSVFMVNTPLETLHRLTFKPLYTTHCSYILPLL